jgi:hypothetical protein
VPWVHFFGVRGDTGNTGDGLGGHDCIPAIFS